MYCATRLSITFHPAITTSGVVTQLSSISASEIPSMPTW